VALVRRSPRSAGLARAVHQRTVLAGPLPAAVTDGFSFKWE
jgi:hypothetical protein